MGKRYPSNSCSFQNCKKNSLSDRIHLFRFPKDENRCQAWVDSCKNPKLVGVPAEKLNRNFRICCDHFNDWCFMNTTLKNSLVHNAIPNAPDPRVKIKIEKEEEDPAEASTTNDILLKSPCLLVHNAIPNAPDPRVKIKIEKQEEDPAEASTTNDILLKSPCLLVHNAIPNAPDPRVKIKIEKQEEDPAEASTTNDILLKSPCLLAHLLQSQNTLIGNTSAYSDMLVKTSTTDHSSTECFPALSPILNDQLSSSHVLPREVKVENSVLNDQLSSSHVLPREVKVENSVLNDQLSSSHVLPREVKVENSVLNDQLSSSHVLPREAKVENSVLNDQLFSSHVLPREVKVENTELHQTVPDSADKSTTRRRKYTPTKAKKLKHYKDSLRKLKSRFSN